MNRLAMILLLAATCIALLAAKPNAAENTASANGKEKIMKTVSGEFDVKLPQLPLADENAHSSLGRRGIDKQFHGALEAVSKGEMLSAMGAAEGSAGYVAIERVSGILEGRKGGFTLMHRGVMSGGKQELLIIVVPDSGTDELEGISGTMNIRIEDGRHFYDFEYSLPE